MKMGSTRRATRAAAMIQRRERKFDKHHLEIRDGFIYVRGHSVAGTGALQSQRSLLKHAHQICRNLERGLPPIDGQRSRADYEHEERAKRQAAAASRSDQALHNLARIGDILDEMEAAGLDPRTGEPKKPTRRGKRGGR